MTRTSVPICVATGRCIAGDVGRHRTALTERSTCSRSRRWSGRCRCCMSRLDRSCSRSPLSSRPAERGRAAPSGKGASKSRARPAPRPRSSRPCPARSSRTTRHRSIRFQRCRTPGRRVTCRRRWRRRAAPRRGKDRRRPSPSRRCSTSDLDEGRCLVETSHHLDSGSRPLQGKLRAGSRRRASRPTYLEDLRSRVLRKPSPRISCVGIILSIELA